MGGVEGNKLSKILRFINFSSPHLSLSALQRGIGAGEKVDCTEDFTDCLRVLFLPLKLYCGYKK